jgi:AraC-like DNA-binding protein
MSRYYYNLGKEHGLSIRGTVKLLDVANARYGGDWHCVPHTHKYTELFFIVGGNGQFLIEDRYYPAMNNNLIIINPNVLHTEVSLNAQPLEYIVLGVDGIELLANESGNEQFAILEHFEDAEISGCLRNILREMEKKSPGYEDICQAYTEVLIIRLMRSISLTVPAEPQAKSANRQCAAVKRYIDLHFKEPLTLDSLAEEGHINKYYLAHTFKKEYGVSPINYMIAKRIEESKYLLTETDLSLSQIAHLLGFSSLSYFSQVFRRVQSISPKEYRQQLNKL